MQGWLATRSGVCVCNCYYCCVILLLLRPIFIKRWRHIIMKAMERVQLVDQVRTPGTSVDAAHIDEKRSKRRVELRPISFSDPKRGRGVVETLQPRFGSSSTRFGCPVEAEVVATR